jgi:hypothetical protein
MKEGAHFACIEALHGDAPYGAVLDAGTGPRSIRWLAGLQADRWTAVTGDPSVQRQVQRLVDDAQRPQDQLVLGNWNDPGLLAGERFDTVLADHLLGAVEGFAPYFQTSLFARLRALTGTRLYVTGMQPYVIARPADPAGRLIWEIGRYRDACLLLLGRQPYREFPLDWVMAELRRSGFKPMQARKIATGYKANFVNGQIDLARPGLERMADQALGQALIARGDALRTRALAHLESHGALKHGFSYVIAAEPV